MKILFASLIALTPVSSLAAPTTFVQDIPHKNEIWREQAAGYSRTKTCYRTEYREEYIPGTEQDPGYVKSWKETVEFPCNNNRATIIRERSVEYREVDENDCSDGKVAGALLGGAAGAAMSRGDGRWWAIPIGAVVGSKIGCDAAGG
tara:strand:- start:530 stop:970 length:441 start_codon:yes stop_codon:yes gene_type:complete